MEDYRSRVIATFVGLLRGHEGLVGVQVEPGDPGGRKQAESVWIDAVGNEGDYSMPVMGVDPVQYVDEWLLPVHVICKPKGRRTLDSTRARLGEIVAAVLDVVRRNPGLTDAELADTYDVESFTLRDRADDVWDTPEGPIGEALVTISVRSRIRGA